VTLDASENVAEAELLMHGHGGAIDERDAVDVAGGAVTGDSEDLRYAWRALSVVSLASILSALNTSALNTALPEVVRHFNATSSQASWILITFLLVSTVVTLICGRAADVMGRRFMYLLGLSLFTVASFLLGLAPNVEVLIALRVVQAIAGAMLLTNSAAIVSSAFPARMLSRGLGIYMASFSVAQLLGPTLGGFLATNFGWRWVFWFNVPVGVVCMIWGAITLRKVESSGPFLGLDIRGNLLLFLGLGGLIVALSETASQGWTGTLVLGGLGAAVVFLPLFWIAERRAKAPVLDVTMFKDRPFAMANAAGFINTLARGSVILIAALYFQAINGDSALRAGLLLLPLSAANALASGFAGGATKYLAPRAVAAIGSAITSVGLLALFLACGNAGSYLWVAIGLILVGVGSGVFMPANITSIIEGKNDDELGIVNAVRLTVQSTGIVIGTALALTVLTAPLAADLRRDVFAGSVSSVGASAVHQLTIGYRWALGAMLAISVLGVIASLASNRAQRVAQAEDARSEELDDVYGDGEDHLRPHGVRAAV
jgi:EmrB/QacA subfamily drug resistance transporter